MQGGWLLATAVGNKLLVVGTILWDKVRSLLSGWYLLYAAWYLQDLYFQYLRGWKSREELEQLSAPLYYIIITLALNYLKY